MIMKYSIGTQVILHTNDTWNDLHGIVDDLLGDTIAVFCITMPLYRYYVNTNDAICILEPVGWHTLEWGSPTTQYAVPEFRIQESEFRITVSASRTDWFSCFFL